MTGSGMKWLVETWLRIQLFFVGIGGLYRHYFPPPTLEEIERRSKKHLENALLYFDKWEHAKDMRDRSNFLRFAAVQIEQARRLDSDATFTFIDQDKQPE